jgi:hypothetical protein
MSERDDEATAIVRTLAASAEPRRTDDNHDESECAVCEGAPVHMRKPLRHAPDCPWVRARAWVDGEKESGR